MGRPCRLQPLGTCPNGGIPSPGRAACSAAWADAESWAQGNGQTRGQMCPRGQLTPAIRRKSCTPAETRPAASVGGLDSETGLGPAVITGLPRGPRGPRIRSQGGRWGLALATVEPWKDLAWPKRAQPEVSLGRGPGQEPSRARGFPAPGAGRQECGDRGWSSPPDTGASDQLPKDDGHLLCPTWPGGKAGRLRVPGQARSVVPPCCRCLNPSAFVGQVLAPWGLALVQDVS